MNTDRCSLQFGQAPAQPKRKYVRRAMIARRVAYLNGEWLASDLASLAREPTPEEIADAQRVGAAAGARWAARSRGL